MTRQELRDLALSCGFKLKEQPDGSMDLNPYVYDFADSVSRASCKDLNSELTGRINRLEQKLFDANMQRLPHVTEKVRADIATEIQMQIGKWGEHHVRSQTVEGHILVLQKKLRDAEASWIKDLKGIKSVQSELTQIAAVAIQALINLDKAGRL